MSDTWAACGGLPGVHPGSVSECSHYIFGENVWNECRVSDTWAACGGLPGVHPGSVSECSHYIFGKNVWNECRVSWGLGKIRCTGRYDNISFIIKTPFFFSVMRNS